MRESVNQLPALCIPELGGAVSSEVGAAAGEDQALISVPLG